MMTFEEFRALNNNSFDRSAGKKIRSQLDEEGLVVQ